MSKFFFLSSFSEKKYSSSNNKLIISASLTIRSVKISAEIFSACIKPAKQLELIQHHNNNVQ